MKIALVHTLLLIASSSTSLAAQDTATNGGGEVSANGSSTTMATCNGNDLTLIDQPALADSRNYIYCELIFNYAGGCGGDIYSTSPLAPCDVTW